MLGVYESYQIRAFLYILVYINVISDHICSFVLLGVAIDVVYTLVAREIQGRVRWYSVCSAPNTPPHNKEQVSSFVRLHARCKTTPGVRRMWPIHIITHLDPFPLTYKLV